MMVVFAVDAVVLQQAALAVDQMLFIISVTAYRQAAVEVVGGGAGVINGAAPLPSVTHQGGRS